MSIKKYTESLYPYYHQGFKVDEVLYEDRSDCQDMILFHNEKFGRILALDGVIQTTQADEACYHEMMVHVPMLSFGNAKNILVIGGGDGGIIREVLKYDIQKVTMVEIDGAVIEFSKKYLPNHSLGAFDNKKLELVIADGAEFVKNTQDKYDVIIVDSTDPIGPAAVLFSQEFYQDCHNILNEGGILVTQNGVPFFQADELIGTWEKHRDIFNHANFYTTVVPTYAGGHMTLSFASDANYTNISLDELTKSYKKHNLGELFYYTPSVHLAAFCLPAFIENMLK
ncbi:MAG: polyamine aminopropyltransferase [Alphaproteobacteria bacterium]